MNSSLKLLLIAFFFAFNVAAIHAQTTFLNVGPIFYGPGLDISYSNAKTYKDNKTVVIKSSSSAQHYSQTAIIINEYGIEEEFTIDSLPYSELYTTNTWIWDEYSNCSLRNYSLGFGPYTNFVNDSGVTLWSKVGLRFTTAQIGATYILIHESDSNKFMCFNKQGVLQWEKSLADYSPVVQYNDSTANLSDFKIFQDEIYVLLKNSDVTGQSYLLKIDTLSGLELQTNVFTPQLQEIHPLNNNWVALCRSLVGGLNKLHIQKLDTHFNAIQTKNIEPNLSEVEWIDSKVRDQQVLLVAIVKDSISNVPVEIDEFLILNEQLDIVNKRFFRATNYYTSGQLFADSKATKINSFDKTDDGGYYFTGIRRPYTYDAANFSLKLDANLMSNDTFFLVGSWGYFGVPDSVFEIAGLGVASINENSSLLIYPNPATSTVSIFSTLLSQNASITLFDIAGKLLLHKQGVSAVNGVFQLDVTSLSTGTYLVQIEAENQVITQKVHVQH